MRHVLIWACVALAVIVPIAIAATSPFLASRNPAYVIAGFAGIIGLAMFVVQPVLAHDDLSGLRAPMRQRLHRWVGAGIALSVGAHIGGLYLTSAPDTLDALLLVSPTPFSVYGVIAMWGVVLTVGLVVLRRRIRLRYKIWRGVHNALALLVVVSTAIHAVQIDGTMGTISKWGLCAVALGITAAVLLDVWVLRPRRLRS